LRGTAQGVVSRFDGESGIPESSDRRGNESRLWLQLMTCSSLIETEIRRRLRDRFDFTPARFDLLSQLAQSKTSMALSDVARQMMVSQSNVTSLTNRLVQSGHIRRTTSPTDRRVQIVSLTAHGRSAFRKMASQRTKWVVELFASVPAKHRATLVKDLAGLEQFVANAIAADRARGHGM
jgi:DNA-binding MarR family transcriptional regulator